MTELDKLKAENAKLKRENAKLQADFDRVMREHMMHLLVAQELSNRMTKRTGALH